MAAVRNRLPAEGAADSHLVHGAAADSRPALVVDSHSVGAAGNRPLAVVDSHPVGAAADSRQEVGNRREEEVADTRRAEVADRS